MTTNTQERDAAGVPPKEELDVFLRHLVDSVNGSDLAFPVTLTVGGGLVSGEMVSGHKFFDGFADDLNRALGKVENQTIKEWVESYRELGKPYLDRPDDAPMPVYIHLRNAQVYLGSESFPSEGGSWWRGRLSEVAGFTLGRLQRQRSA